MVHLETQWVTVDVQTDTNLIWKDEIHVETTYMQLLTHFEPRLTCGNFI